MISPIIVVGGITIRPANGKRAIVEDLTGADALRKGVGIDERLERRTDLRAVCVMTFSGLTAAGLSRLPTNERMAPV